MSEDDIKPRQPREVSLEDAIRLSKDARDVELAELRAWKAEVLRRNAVPPRAAADEIERLREEVARLTRERDDARSDLRALADAARRFQLAELRYGHITARLDRPVDRAECDVAATELREAAAVLRNILSRLDGKDGGNCGTCGGSGTRAYTQYHAGVRWDLGEMCPNCKGGKDGAK